MEQRLFTAPKPDQLTLEDIQAGMVVWEWAGWNVYETRIINVPEPLPSGAIRVAAVNALGPVYFHYGPDMYPPRLYPSPPGPEFTMYTVSRLASER